MSTELNESTQGSFETENSTTTYIGADIGADENLMAAYMETMGTFLQVQENIMLAYLGGTSPTQHRTNIQRPARATNRLPARQHRPASVAPQSPAVMAKPNGGSAAVVMPVPAAHLSPDPVQQIPAPAPAPVNNAAPVANVSSAADSEAIKLDFAAVSGILLEIVEDRTGYPQDMLGLDLNMEADLGIDSIKRVEIVGTLVSALPSGVLDSNDGGAEQLNGMKTLKGMIDFVVAEGGQSSPAA